MFKKLFQTRLDIVKAITVIIFLTMIFRLADLQIVKGDFYRKKSETIRTRSIIVTAPRGNIVDKFGRVLAANKMSYSVNIMKSDIPQKDLNDIALSVVNIIEQNGDTYKDEIPILMNPVRFTFDEDEQSWKQKYNIPQNAEPQEAFAKLRLDYGISPEIIDVEAYDMLKNEYSVELPFNLEEYQYSFRKAEIKWKAANNFKKEITAQEAFDALLQKYKIPKDLYTDDQAKKILAVKYLLGQNRYKAYEPVEIALNIKEETRARIEENKIFLRGVEISQRPIRKYPSGDFAAHIIGHMNKIGDELEELSKKGYNPHDIIGKAGIEYSMEPYLRGQDGSKQIEIDVNGTLINTINEIEPTPGDTVFLTIDSKLQKAAQDALKATMEQIQRGDSSKGVQPFPKGTSGAAVAIDINTGRILAMASEPKFDPNLFAAGISVEDWKALQPKSKDIYEPKPLVNNAISAPLPPGSTLKMVAGIAGLEEGKIAPGEVIVDTGPYTVIPGTAPSCAIWKTSRAVHGAQNIVQALKNSCNYYFFEVGRRIGGDAFETYAEKLGFGQYTGIDLPFEYKGKIEGPRHKQEDYKRSLGNYLTYRLKIKDEGIKDEVKSFITEGITSKSEIKKRLKALGITDTAAVDRIYRYVLDSRWQPGNVLNAAIGQGSNNVTPIQLANYMATLINGGKRYKPYLVDRIISYDGTTKLTKQPEVTEQIHLDAEYVDWIKKGMLAVTTEAGGTARSVFNGAKVTVAGKTGTAEAGKAYDNHAWFLAFAPYEKPEIAISVVIFQGGHGNYAAPVARAIAEQYLAPEEVADTVAPQNDITP